VRVLLPVAVLILAAAGLILAGFRPAGADDAISRLMKSQDDAAKNLPVAPAKPLPAQVAGPTVGSKPQGPLPMVMGGRTAEKEARTRLVIELSDPVNLRAFSLAGPDRV